jgi:hypothetical protein
VPVASAGELIPAGQRGIGPQPRRRSGLSDVAAIIPPQNFDPTGLVPMSGGPLSIRMQPQTAGPWQLTLLWSAPELPLQQALAGR